MTSDARTDAAAIGRPGVEDGPGSSAPGVLLCLAAAALAFAVSQLVTVSAIMVALLLGTLLTNTVGVAPRLRPGVDVAAKRLLRIGVVLLGLQLVVRDLVGLGGQFACIVIGTVAVTFVGTEVMGRLLGVPPTLTTLVAAGFSICGAAAVAAVSGVTESDEEEVATAVGLVTLFGTGMILLIPVSADLLGLTERQAGFWAGAAVHEVAQVIAAAGAVSAAAAVMSMAVSTKLARVVLLAPVTLTMGLRNSRRRRTHTAKATPWVPLFVVGFLVAATLRYTGVVPDPILAAAQVTQSVLLAAAMFGLGCAVRVRALIGLGARSVLLALASTTFAATTSLLGIIATT